MAQPYERDPRFSPDSWRRIQETEFELATRTIVQHLRDVKKGNPFRPSRGRPNVDFTTIATGKKRGSLDLYACGKWGSVKIDGTILEIGDANETPPDVLLRLYTLEDDGLVQRVTEQTPISLDALADETQPEEERERLYYEHVDPILQDYIAKNREPLLEQLVHDTVTALGRLIG